MVAVVTGGSRGIGLGIAKELLKEDFFVVLSARNKSDELEKLQKEFQNKIHFVPCDISKFDEVQSSSVQS